jgi:hypothetical protein
MLKRFHWIFSDSYIKVDHPEKSRRQLVDVTDSREQDGKNGKPSFQAAAQPKHRIPAH